MTDQDMTALQRAQQDLGKQISLDNFLFSCLEHENLLQSSQGTPEDGAWPELEKIGEGQAAHINEHLDALCHWVKEGCNELSFDELIDISKVTYFVPVAVRLAQSLENLTKRIYPAPPAFDSRKSPKHEFWQVSLEKLRHHFPQQFDLIESYLWWTFGPTPIDDIDPASRPPVGRFASFSRPRQSSTSTRPQGRSFERGNRQTGQRNSGGRKDTRPGRGREGSKRPPKDIETTLRKEVLLAVGKLQQEATLDSVALTPQNSFHRRLQHQMISEEGFASVSTGEGDERAVRVVRPGNSS